VLLDGFERDEEPLLDLMIRITAHDKVDDLGLSRGEPERREPFVEVGPTMTISRCPPFTGRWPRSSRIAVLPPPKR
jgi:hypothetical protein